VDVGVLAATNRDLQSMVSGGGFREDLFYRLNVFPIRLPTLRERTEDIPLLARHFAGATAGGGGLNREAEEVLRLYGWPGNVRELENVIERAGILAGPDGEITGELISQLLGEGGTAAGEQRVTIPDTGVDIEELEKQHIVEALRKAGGNKTEAARLLHISRRRLYSRMDHHKIEY